MSGLPLSKRTLRAFKVYTVPRPTVADLLWQPVTRFRNPRRALSLLNARRDTGSNRGWIRAVLRGCTAGGACWLFSSAEAWLCRTYQNLPLDPLAANHGTKEN